MNSGVYIITNVVTGDRYIGSSKNIYVRIRVHWNQLRKGKHHNHFMQCSWNKYGEDAFQYCILELTECTKAALLNCEQYYIDTLKPEFNANPIAATQLGFKQSEETKKKISEGHKGNLNGMSGKSHSSETKAKMTQVLRGHSVSEETRKKISETILFLPVEEKIKIATAVSVAQTGRHLSEEHKNKLSKAATGQIRDALSEEQKAKISASLKGHAFHGNQYIKPVIVLVAQPGATSFWKGNAAER